MLMCFTTIFLTLLQENKGLHVSKSTVLCSTIDEDVRALAAPVLRHRVLVGYRAEAEGVDVEDVIARLLEAVPETV